MSSPRGPKQKALSINLDSSIYGTFAEIGAGQEVARYFFQAGGAAGTMAKAMSAYDMEISDIIYGKEKSKRYVCEDRLHKMLDREFELLVKRLKTIRPEDTRFFSFANTVAAKSFSGKGDCHGWLGVKFQHAPNSSASEAIIHIRMLDQENLQQQEAIGKIGVNLLYACFHHHNDSCNFLESLMDELTSRRIVIDMIRVKGQAFLGMDNRLLSLELVKHNFCQAVMFDASGKVIQISDTLYKKNLLVVRGSYRPPTFVNIDMLNSGTDKLKSELNEDEKNNILTLPEICISKLKERGEVDNDDFLSRVDLLSGLGYSVLISGTETIEDLSLFLRKASRKKVSFVLGVYPFEDMMNPLRYAHVKNGMMGALGKFFGNDTSVYVYPAKDDTDNTKLKNLETVEIFDDVMFLYLYLLEKGHVREIEDFNLSHSEIWSRTVLRMIQTGKKGWEKMVPETVVRVVKKKNLFGFKKGSSVGKNIR